MEKTISFQQRTRNAHQQENELKQELAEIAKSKTPKNDKRSKNLFKIYKKNS